MELGLSEHRIFCAYVSISAVPANLLGCMDIANLYSGKINLEYNGDVNRQFAGDFTNKRLTSSDEIGNDWTSEIPNGENLHLPTDPATRSQDLHVKPNLGNTERCWAMANFSRAMWHDTNESIYWDQLGISWHKLGIELRDLKRHWTTEYWRCVQKWWIDPKIVIGWWRE